MQMTIMGYDSANQAAHASLGPDVEKTFAIPEGSQPRVLSDLDPQVRSRMEEMWTEVLLSWTGAAGWRVVSRGMEERHPRRGNRDRFMHGETFDGPV